MRKLRVLINQLFKYLNKGKGTEREVVCGQVWWPILRIENEVYTHSSEHTPGAVGSQCCGARGAVGGSVLCSRVSPQSWYWGWRECWLFTPPTNNPCRTWDSNPWPSGYKSNSLSIRPRHLQHICLFPNLRIAESQRVYILFLSHSLIMYAKTLSSGAHICNISSILACNIFESLSSSLTAIISCPRSSFIFAYMPLADTFIQIDFYLYQGQCL